MEDWWRRTLPIPPWWRPNQREEERTQRLERGYRAQRQLAKGMSCNVKSRSANRMLTRV